jgi:hypothetical protein
MIKAVSLDYSTLLYLASTNEYNLERRIGIIRVVIDSLRIIEITNRDLMVIFEGEIDYLEAYVVTDTPMLNMSTNEEDVLFHLSVLVDKLMLIHMMMYCGSHSHQIFNTMHNYFIEKYTKWYRIFPELVGIELRTPMDFSASSPYIECIYQAAYIYRPLLVIYVPSNE